MTLELEGQPMNCANCGTENPAGSAFCGGCGQPLPAGAEAPASPPTAPVPPVPPAGPPPAAPTTPPAPIPPIPPVPPVPPVVPPGGDPTVVSGAPPVPPVPPDATTTYATPPPAAPVPPVEKKSKKSLLLGLLALLVVGAVVGSFLVLGGDDDDGDASSGGSSEIVLEPISQTLRDDFAGNLDLETFDSSIARLLPDVPPLEDGIASALSARRADGDEPGLYGGSRDTGTCDVSALIDFLTDDDNAAKAEAWAEVQGIDVDEIEDFIEDLTPVRLRFDTRVTNHGFTDGAANGFQSVLEAGTAVLVDDTGVPRVKCNCGNPLAEPADLGDLDEDEAFDVDVLVQNADDAWDDFDPELIVVIIEADDPVDAFTLVDIDTGELFERPVGTDGEEDTDADLDEVCELLGDSPSCTEEPPEDTTTTTEDTGETTTTVELGTGDVQVTLRWDSAADLDLVVIDPNGEEASRSGTTTTGGQLDVDSNIGCTDEGSIENVFWPPGSAPVGAYTVVVEGFATDSCSQGPQSGDYEVTVTVAGQQPQVFTGTVAEDGESTHTFAV